MEYSYIYNCFIMVINSFEIFKVFAIIIIILYVENELDI